MRSILLRIGIVAAFVLGAFLLRGFLPGSAGSLAVGDCFDRPTELEGTVDDVQHHPCTDTHTAEVVFVGDFAPATDLYPSNQEFRTFFETTCTQSFNAYTGLDFVTDPTYDMAAFTPTIDGWGGGDHKVICYALRIDEGPMNASIKKL